MRHIFEQDVDTLLKDTEFEKLFKVVATHPPLITKYLAKSITLETLVILNQLISYVKDFDNSISEPVVWPDLKRKVVKYQPFLSIDKPKYKKILLSKFG